MNGEQSSYHLSGWTLMALVTALVGWDNRYGSFLSLVMLLLSSRFLLGGSYPIELSPKFFQVVHPIYANDLHCNRFTSNHFDDRFNWYTSRCSFSIPCCFHGIWAYHLQTTKNRKLRLLD